MGVFIFALCFYQGCSRLLQSGGFTIKLFLDSSICSTGIHAGNGRRQSVSFASDGIFGADHTVTLHNPRQGYYLVVQHISTYWRNFIPYKINFNQFLISYASGWKNKIKSGRFYTCRSPFGYYLLTVPTTPLERGFVRAISPKVAWDSAKGWKPPSSTQRISPTALFVSAFFCSVLVGRSALL